MLDFDDSRGLKVIKEQYAWFQENEKSLLNEAAVLLGKDNLDYSIREIDAFGVAVQEVLNGQKPANASSFPVHTVFIAYYGNAFMHYFGGKWYYSTKKDVYGYGSPMIIEYGKRWSAIPPYGYFTSVEKGDFGNLSYLIERKIRVNEGLGIPLVNPMKP